MSNNILDNPIHSPLVKIRKFYFDALEWTILIANAFFIILGVFICWSIAFKEGTWLFLINPTVFVLLFGIPPFHYIYKFRKASIKYDFDQDLSLLQELSNHVAVFLTPVILGLWLLIFALFSDLFLKSLDNNFFMNQSTVLLSWRLALLLPVLILGPVQFFFIRKLHKINKKLNPS